MSYLNSIKTVVATLYEREPTRAIGLLTAAVVVALTKLGIVVPEVDIAEALAYAVPVLIGAEAVRTKVTPTPIPSEEAEKKVA